MPKLPVMARLSPHGTDLAPHRGFMVLSADHGSARQPIPASRFLSHSLSALGSRIWLRREVSLVPWSGGAAARNRQGLGTQAGLLLRNRHGRTTHGAGGFIRLFQR